jgi:Putative adhesin
VADVTDTDTTPRPPRKWGWQAIASALGLLAVIAAGVTVWLWQRAPVHLTAVTSTGPHTAQYRRVTREAPARLVVRMDAGDLSVGAGRAGQVSEQRQLTWQSRPPVITQTFARGTLTITARCPSGQQTCGADVELGVPRGVSVQADVLSGDVAISGLRGLIGVTTNAGDIRLTGLAGVVRARSDNGDIIGEQLASGQVGALDQAGDISLAFTGVPDAVSAASNAGGVSIEVPRLAGGYRVRATTSKGDRSVSVQQDSRSSDGISVASITGDVAVAYSQP